MITALSVPTWESAMREFLLHVKATKAEKTLTYYRTQLTGLYHRVETKGISFTDFRKRHLYQYLAVRVEQGVAQLTLHHDAVCAKAFFAWCSANDLLDSSPLAEYRVRKAPKPSKYVPTEEELRRLLNGVMDYWDPKKNPKMVFVTGARRSFHRDRNFAVLLALMDSAARVDEILSLKLDDYDAQALAITIRKSKGRRPRTIPVSPELRDTVDVWLKLRTRLMKGRDDEGWLFMSDSGGKLPYRSFHRSFTEAREFASLNPKITLHGMRHHSLHRIAKVSPIAANRIAGHANMNTTMIYVHDDPDFVREQHALVGVARGVLKNPRYEAKKRKRLI